MPQIHILPDKTEVLWSPGLELPGGHRASPGCPCGPWCRTDIEAGEWRQTIRHVDEEADDDQ